VLIIVLLEDMLQMVHVWEGGGDEDILHYYPLAKTQLAQLVQL
jgi:hypothetical protein